MTSLLEEKDAIRDLMAAYCFAVDAEDFDRYASLFTEDGELESGPTGKIVGRAAILAFFRALPKGMLKKTKHCTINALITVDGSIAHAESYIIEFLTTPDGIRTILVGRYEDALRKEADGWRIRRRVIHYDLAEDPAAVMQKAGFGAT